MCESLDAQLLMEAIGESLEELEVFTGYGVVQIDELRRKWRFKKIKLLQ